MRGQVASPTFIIARVHPPLRADGTGPALVHVDAYRLGSLDEVDALDLDASLDESVTVVEWGEGLGRGRSREDRLEVALAAPARRGADRRRTVEDAAAGERARHACAPSARGGRASRCPRRRAPVAG